MLNKELRELYLSELDFDWEGKTYAFRRLLSYYECAIMEIETKFKVLNREFSLNYDKNPIESIQSRIKSNPGIVRKLKKKGLPVTLEAMEEYISDIAGLRIICSFPEDVYLVEKCFLEQDDVRLVRRKDYIAHPKENGYRSLHLIVEVPIFLADEKKWVRAEIQIRTMAMDFWASLEHKLRYKKNLSERAEKEISQSLKLAAETCGQLDDEMQRVYTKIKDEI